MEVKSQPCKFGSQCARPDCWFSHDAKPEPVSCKFGAQCTRANCWFAHSGLSMPADKHCKAMPPCKDGLQCTRSDCWFQHPEGWDAKAAKATPCLHGARCTRVDCWFQHPADRLDPRSEEVQRERYARSVFVGRLAVAGKSGAKETKDEDLTKYFEQFGGIVVGSVTRANNSRDGKSRGFGLVEFRTKEAAEAALKKGHPTWDVQVRRFQPAGGTFIAVDRSHRVTVESQIMRLKPHDIRFSHHHISFCFSDGKSVDDTIEKCLAGTSHFEDAPAPHVVKNPDDGLYYSLSNRRLFVARVLSSKGFRFGPGKDQEGIEVKLFPFNDRHVQAQWQQSFRSDCQGRFVVPSLQCGSCKTDHMSSFMDAHVLPGSVTQLRAALSRRPRKRPVQGSGRFTGIGIDDSGSDSETFSAFLAYRDCSESED